ncbi:hypothetical protein ACFVSN_12910 [Kitasatospora sp. NPDC057904]|uniref:hypothetical protein n=1 Tax=Kitasatospora sp. NPDC057904 TaxID=3346275 RepID=UPI0036DE0E05
MAMIRRISFAAAAAAAAAAMLGVAGTAHAVGSKTSDGLGEAPIDQQTCGFGSESFVGAKDPVGEADWGKAGKVTSGFFYSDKQQERRTDDIVACLKDGQILLYQNESDGFLEGPQAVRARLGGALEGCRLHHRGQFHRLGQ